MNAINLKDILSLQNRKAIVVTTINLLDEKLLQEIVNDLGYRLFRINGEEIGSKDDLLNHLTGILQFPEYFGYNWDALNDCLSDLEWFPPVKGYVLLFSHPDGLIRNSPSDFKIFLDIITTVFEYWEHQNVRFVLILGLDKEINVANI